MNEPRKQETKDENPEFPQLPMIEVPADIFLIGQEKGNPPLMVPVKNLCRFKIVIHEPELVANDTRVKIKVEYESLAPWGALGDEEPPGLYSIHFEIERKYLVFYDLGPDAAPLLAPHSIDHTWATATFEVTTTDEQGVEHKTTELAKVVRYIARENGKCPPRRVVEFEFPVEAVLKKYVRFTAWATCCGNENGSIKKPVHRGPYLYW